MMKLWTALSAMADAANALAANLHALSATVGEANANARHNLGLSESVPGLPEPDEKPARRGKQGA